MIFANHFKRVKCSYSRFINLTETAGFFFFSSSVHTPSRAENNSSFVLFIVSHTSSQGSAEQNARIASVPYLNIPYFPLYSNFSTL